MKKLINNRKGDINLVFAFILIIFLLASIYSAYIYITYNTKYKIQGIMDDSGVAALRYATNDDRTMREEKLIINKKDASDKYRELLERQISVGRGGIIDYEIRKLNVYDANDSRTREISGAAVLDQAYIESVVVVKYNSVSNVVKGEETVTMRFKNFFEDRIDSESSRDIIGDGSAEMVLRSVSRYVYE